MRDSIRGKHFINRFFATLVPNLFEPSVNEGFVSLDMMLPLIHHRNGPPPVDRAGRLQSHSHRASARCVFAYRKWKPFNGFLTSTLTFATGLKPGENEKSFS